MIKVEYIAHAGNDISVVNAARVSFAARVFDDELSERDIRLINYLAKHKHKSPFNHAWASFRVTAPIFVARQLVKHAYLPWNEISRRYVSTEPEFWQPDMFRQAAPDKKQGSKQEPIADPELANSIYKAAIEKANEAYRALLQLGVCPEQARAVLPLSTYTSWVWSGTLFAWFSMAQLRLAPDAQYESRLVAQSIAQYMKSLFPVSWQALMEHYGA